MFRDSIWFCQGAQILADSISPSSSEGASREPNSVSPGLDADFLYVVWFQSSIYFLLLLFFSQTMNVSSQSKSSQDGDGDSKMKEATETNTLSQSERDCLDMWNKMHDRLEIDLNINYVIYAGCCEGLSFVCVSFLYGQMFCLFLNRLVSVSKSYGVGDEYD